MANKANIPNPMLKSLEVLVGDWQTTGTHHMIPGVTMHGQASFAWIEGGAYLIMRSTIDHPDVPDGLAIFGSDDEADAIWLSYFDERGISRKYDFSIDGNSWKWWRNHPKFSQRFRATIGADGQTMVGKGEICQDDKTWEGDLDLTYTRVN